MDSTQTDPNLQLESWDMHDVDRDFLAKYIEPNLPDTIFDAHAHLYATSNWAAGELPDYLSSSPAEVTLALYAEHMQSLHGRRLRGGLFLGFAFQGDLQSNNEFVAQQVASAPATFAAYGEMLVEPSMDAEYVRQEVRRLGLSGLKPYNWTLRRDDSCLATIEEYLPEQHVRIAHEEHLVITLHIVRPGFLSDARNLEALSRLSRTYPDARFIMAHAGVGLNPWNLIDGLRVLGRRPNIWWDTSCVCEPAAYQVLIETFGHDRLLYGTDFFASQMRGRYVAIGDHYVMAAPHGEFLDGNPAFAPVRPVMVGLESLRALLLAVHLTGLRDGQIEDIFAGNALRLLDGGRPARSMEKEGASWAG